MKLRPLFDKILVRRDSAQQQTEAGIIIPDAAKEVPNSGIVVATGEGRLCFGVLGWRDADNNPVPSYRAHVEPLRVKAGDRVLFHTYAGTEVQDKETKDTLLLMCEDDVLGVLEE
jgi:chaperonin GroES